MSVMVPTSTFPPTNKTVRQAVTAASQRLRGCACQWPDGTVTPPVHDKDAAPGGPTVESFAAKTPVRSILREMNTKQLREYSH